VEQLRIALHRHHGGTGGGCARRGGPHHRQRGYLTKHSFGLYGTEPPSTEFRWEDVQPAVDAEPTRVAEEEWTGVGTVETWTTPFSREGAPEKVFLAVRTPDETRALAVLDDASEAETSVREDIAGAKVRVHADGTAGLL
jgi:acetyl-CoA C-acetyltransferase